MTSTNSFSNSNDSTIPSAIRKKENPQILFMGTLPLSSTAHSRYELFAYAVLVHYMQKAGIYDNYSLLSSLVIS